MKFELIPLISFIAANEMKWRIKQTENIITVNLGIHFLLFGIINVV